MHLTSPPCKRRARAKVMTQKSKRTITISISISHQSSSYIMAIELAVQPKSEGYDPANNASTKKCCNAQHESTSEQ